MYGHGYHPSKGCLDSPDGAAGSRVPLRGPGQLVDPRANLRQIERIIGFSIRDMSSSVLRSASSLPVRAFSAQLSKGLGQAPARFVQEMIVGIHRAQSLHLTDIARSLGENINLHATHKRLSRNLGKKDLIEFISTALLDRAASNVTQDMILVVQYYDLPKQCARHMEYVRGSDIASFDDGYAVCDISAIDPASPDRYMPLLSRLWSRHAPDYQNDATEILTAVNRVNSATRGRGVFYCHPATLYPDLFWMLANAPNLRTVQFVHDREMVFMVDGQPRRVSELLASVELPYGKLMFKMVDATYARWITADSSVNNNVNNNVNDKVEMSMFVAFGASTVQLPDSGKQGELVIQANSTNVGADVRGLSYLTTGVTVDTRDQLWTVLQNEFLATDTERVVVNHKSRFNPSDVRVLTYDRLRLLNVLLQAVTHYEAYIEQDFAIQDHIVTSEPHPGGHYRDFLLSKDQFPGY